MLPETLFSSYDQYKQDTAFFTTWLVQMAAKCGHKVTTSKGLEPSPLKQPEKGSQEPSGGRLKGKERAAAKSWKARAPPSETESGPTSTSILHRYTFTTEELLLMSHAVAESRVKLPTSLRSIVVNSIKARKRCAKWFQQFKVQDQHSNEGHLHFIKILEQSLEMLDPHAAAADHSSPAETPSNFTDSSKTTTDLDHSANRFGPLNFEDTPQADNPADLVAIVDSMRTHKKISGQPVVESYVLEDEEDMTFLIFSFFEDLHRIQGYIQGLWKGWSDDNVSLMSAAVVTNIAYDLVSRAEERILTTAPNLFNRKCSYESIAIIIFYADALEKGICPVARLQSDKTLELTDFDDFIYLSTARILMKFTFVRELSACDSSAYPLPYPSMRESYVSRPDLLGTPQMNKKEMEDMLLSHLVSEHHLVSNFKKDVGDPQLSPVFEEDIRGVCFREPPMDELGKHISKFLKDGILSVALVFASQVWLDMQAILENDKRKAFQELQETTKFIEKTLNFKPRDDARHPLAPGEGWHETDKEIPVRIRKLSQYWVLSPRFLQYKEHVISRSTLRPTAISFDSSYDRSSFKKEIETADSAAKPVMNQVIGPINGDTESAAVRKRAELRRDPQFNVIEFNSSRYSIGPPIAALQEYERVCQQQMIPEVHMPNLNEVDTAQMHRSILDLKMPGASTNPYFIMTSNPVYCGLLTFNLLTDFERAGIALCDWQQTVWPVAHLYSALRQKPELIQLWPEMEAVLALHQEELFSGGAPASPNKFFSCYATKLRVAPTSFAKSGQRTKQIRKGEFGVKLRTTAATALFRGYFDQHELSEVCYAQLAQAFEEAQQGSKNRKARNRPLTDLQFLTKLTDWLSQQNSSVRLDYVTLSKQCAQLLVDIRNEMMGRLKIHFPTSKLTDNSDHYLTQVVYKIFRVTSKPQPTIRYRNRRFTPPSPLQIASKHMEAFLRTYRPERIVTQFNSLPRLAGYHWHISIRNVPGVPLGDFVFFVETVSGWYHPGAIQASEGQAPNHILDFTSPETLQVIARIILKAFIHGMNVSKKPGEWRPSSLCTNDADFAKRITKVFRDMGVRKEALMRMEVAGADATAKSDEIWEARIVAPSKVLVKDLKDPSRFRNEQTFLQEAISAVHPEALKFIPAAASAGTTRTS